MLIAEELLLLLTDEQSGAARVDSTMVNYAVAGAVLLELSLGGRVDVAGEGETTKKGRLVVLDPSPTGDAILDRGLSTLGAKQNKRPPDVIRHLAKGVTAEVYGRLAEQRIVEKVSDKAFGVLPRTRWPVVDPMNRRRIHQEIVQAVTGPGSPQPNAAAVISLLAAIDKLQIVASPDETGLTRRQIKRRGKEISADNWAPKAVKDAVAAVNMAITAGVIAAVAATGSAG